MDPSYSGQSYSGKTVWVARPDGGQQCEPGSGRSLEESAAELKKAHVRVLNAQKRGDGKMRAQMCGISSGKEDRLQIPEADLPRAVSAGFHEVAP